jgi:hypothetical protein
VVKLPDRLSFSVIRHRPDETRAIVTLIISPGRTVSVRMLTAGAGRISHQAE